MIDKRIIILLILVAIVNYIKADEIQYVEGDICVSHYYNENRKCKIIYTVDGSEHFLNKRCSKYTFNDNECTDSSRLALEKKDFNFLMGVMANFLGLTMMLALALIIGKP